MTYSTTERMHFENCLSVLEAYTLILTPQDQFWDRCLTPGTVLGLRNKLQCELLTSFYRDACTYLQPSLNDVATVQNYLISFKTAKEISLFNTSSASSRQ
jgi:hypothetical protein